MRYIPITLLLLFLSSCSPKPLSLALNPPKENALKYQVTIEQDIQTKTMGQEEDQYQMEQTDYEYTILDISEEGDMDVEIKIDEVKVEHKNQFMNISFDSRDRKEPSDRVERIYSHLVGAEFITKMKSDGSVVEFTGADEIYDQIYSNEEFPDEAKREVLKATLKRQFGNEVMKENMNMISQFYPSDDIEIGDSWTKTIDRSTNFGMILENKYQLVKRQKGKSWIEIEGKMMPLPEGFTTKIGTLTIHYNLNGVQTGTIVVDEKSGWPLSVEIEQSFGGDMQIESPELPFGAVDATMKVKGRISSLRLDNY